MRITLDYGHPNEREIEDPGRVSFWLGQTRIDVSPDTARGHDVLEVYSPDSLVVVPVASNVIHVRPDHR